MAKLTDNEMISLYKKAYELGKKHAASGNYKCWYTPRLEIAYLNGFEGISIDFDRVVTGYRFGECPKYSSFNYRDNQKENGVSLAALDGQKEVGSTMFFEDRKKVTVKGLLIGTKGSDGEPLVLPLDMFEQYDY